MNTGLPKKKQFAAVKINKKTEEKIFVNNWKFGP